MTREEALRATADGYRRGLMNSSLNLCPLCNYSIEIYHNLPISVRHVLYYELEAGYHIFCPIYQIYEINCADLPAESSYKQYRSTQDKFTRLKYGERVADALEKLI